jgi:hypothetical protein
VTDQPISGLSAASAGAIPDTYCLEVADPTVANYKAKPSQLRAPTFVQSGNPGVSLDNTQGAFVGATCFATTLGGLWICTDPSTGAAIWLPAGLEAPISRTVAGAAQANFSFSSIPQQGRHLRLEISGPHVSNGALRGQVGPVGGAVDTAGNYGYIQNSATYYGLTEMYLGGATGYDASSLSDMLINLRFPRYSEVRAGFGKMAQYQETGGNWLNSWSSSVGGAFWKNTAAVGTILVYSTAGNIQQGTTATLYMVN